MKSNNVRPQSEHTTTDSDNSRSPMRILLFYSGLNARAFWRTLVETQLTRLQNLAEIASARVTLEKRHELGPPFRVKALLEVPGPDFHAEASDHTLLAALHKVVRNLERQIQSRKARLAQRRKTRPQTGLLPRLPSMAFGGHRA